MTPPTPRATTDWSGERERSNLWTLRLMRFIAVRAGRPIARAVLHPITLYFLLVNGRARRESRRYLARVLPHPVRWRDLYRHIHCFSATVLDRVYFLQGDSQAFDIGGTDSPALNDALAAGRGLMMVGAHLGSFEALRSCAQSQGARVAMLMYEDNARLINATLAALAPQHTLHTIGLGRPGAMLALHTWLDDGGVAGLLADRTLPGQSERSRTHVLSFLGSPARFSEGPFRLAAILRRQVIFMTGLYLGGNRYDLRFVELADFRAIPRGDTAAVDALVRDALRRYVALLESLCREAPYNWFNFFNYWSDDDTSPARAAPR